MRTIALSFFVLWALSLAGCQSKAAKVKQLQDQYNVEYPAYARGCIDPETAGAARMLTGEAKPEEIIRQLWIHRLLVHYHYPLARLQVEYPITFGRDTSKRADIIVMDSDRPTVPYLIVEVKREKAKDGKEQLKSYTHATGAPLALWSDGSQAITWHRKNPNYFVEIPDLPTAEQTIEQIVNEPWTMETLIEKEKEREAEGIKARSLRQLIEDMEDEVLANAGVDVFEEVFKLIFTKLYDELACYRGKKGQKKAGSIMPVTSVSASLSRTVAASLPLSALTQGQSVRLV